MWTMGMFGSVQEVEKEGRNGLHYSDAYSFASSTRSVNFVAEESL